MSEVTYKSRKKVPLGSVLNEYEEYSLTSVVVREVFAADERAVDGSVALVYFFMDKSLCTHKNGDKCGLPHARSGDLCIIRGKEWRVAEAAYYNETGCAHVRLKLK